MSPVEPTRYRRAAMYAIIPDDWGRPRSSAIFFEQFDKVASKK
jgi:hypothetical protein